MSGATRDLVVMRPTTAKCTECGKEFPVARKGPMPTVCGAACRQGKSRYRRGVIRIQVVVPVYNPGTGRFDAARYEYDPLHSSGIPLSALSRPGSRPDDALGALFDHFEQPRPIETEDADPTAAAVAARGREHAEGVEAITEYLIGRLNPVDYEFGPEVRARVASRVGPWAGRVVMGRVGASMDDLWALSRILDKIAPLPVLA